MSVWEPPAEGYVSIKEQEEEFERLKHIENVKVRIKLELLKFCMNMTPHRLF